jgi:hypothetical protein
LNPAALIHTIFKDKKKLEFTFIAVFSIVILILFYTVLSMNGVILGNDPSVHLEKARIFLNTEQIPLSNLSWTPPLYEIVLAMFISLSGARDIGQLIFIVKALTVIVNWLMVMSVYLLASKFFTKKVGAIAAVLLLFCFPVFELNQWGGSTSVLGIAFLMLLLLYLPLSSKRFGYVVVTFFAAFSVVLAHQLATFLAVLVLPPMLIYMLIKSRGSNLKVLIALVFGGGIAFFIYYFGAMIGHLDILLEHLFFSQKTYAYQIGATTLSAFIINFGFISLLTIAGVYLAYKQLKPAKKMAFFIGLIFALIVPFVLAESHLLGLYLPFQWFIYYLTPPMAIFAAVTVAFVAQKLPRFYANHRASFRKTWVRVVAIGLIVGVCLTVVVRADVVYGKIMEAGTFYATTDIKAYEAGIWLRDNYPNNATVVVTEIPGFWFQQFSDKPVIAQTNPIIERNLIAESVLTLSYEIEHPQTLLKAYGAKGDITDENYVSLDHVWNRVSYSSATGDFLYFTQEGTEHQLPLSALSKQITLQGQGDTQKISLSYSNENFTVTKTMQAQNNTYPLDVSWTVTPLIGGVSNVTLYLSTFFDLHFTFDKAQIPQAMDWVNPWDADSNRVSKQETGNPKIDWAVATFLKTDLKNGYLGLYDSQNNIAYAFNFTDRPEWGNIGALANQQIDAVRFQYSFSNVEINQTVKCSYQVLTLSKNSFPQLTPNNLESIVGQLTPEFPVVTRDYSDYIHENNIGFIVYDRNQLDTQIINSKILQLIYSNDRYVIFKIQ